MMVYIATGPQTYTNVMSYPGVLGDGSHDDTAGIQAAIDAVSAAGSGTVFFPSGSYVITSPLIIDHDCITLLGSGHHFNPTIVIGPTADPSYALIVGNTAYINFCEISGLTFLGRSSTALTGGGIHLRSNATTVRDVRVQGFGGAGIKIEAYTGTIFETLFEDVALFENGQNATTPGDNLVIANNVSDCEYIRVVSAGNAAKTFTRYCINVGGGQHKFIECHVYLAASDGLYSTGNDTQIIGGEYETNGVNGMNIEGVTNVEIIGVSCFGNTGGQDILINASPNFIIDSCNCSSASSNFNIAVYSTTGGIISNCVAKNTVGPPPINMQGTSCVVHDCILSGSTGDALQTGTTFNDIHDNTLLVGGISETTGADYNTFHHNTIPSGKTITLVGTHSRAESNPGFNPRGQVTAPTFPASTVAVTNTTGSDVTAYIANGTAAITVVQIAGVAGTYVTTGYQIAASGWGTVRLPAGGSVKFTYASGSPTWTWMGD